MLYTIVAYTVLTGATAFAPDAQTFVVLQFFARTFAVAEVLLAFVVIVEEFDAAHRGWGIGALVALGAMGSGLALALFALVDVLPFGWRALYLVGLVPLALITYFRRSLPETERFARAQTAREQQLAREQQPARAPQPVPVQHSAGAVRQPVIMPRRSPALAPMIELLSRYPGRLAGVAAVVALLAFAENAGGFFVAKYLQEAHGWAPWQYSVVGLIGGFIGVFGSAYAGRLSDRFGRKPVGFLFLLLHPLALAAFYQIGGPMLGVLWTVRVFMGIGADVVLGAYGNELFATSHRSTAAGTRMIAATLGGVAGLAAESWLYTLLGSHWTAVSILALFALAAPVILLRFPETSRRRLEDVAANDARG